MSRLGVAAPGTMGTHSTQGTAILTGAPVFDADIGPTTPPGTGSFSVLAHGTPYVVGAADSFAYVVQAESPSGALVDYLVTGAAGPISVLPSGVEVASLLYVVVPAAEFAPGASIALDGVDRVALFIHGDVAAEPTMGAVAEVGTVTFGAGGIAIGDTIDLTLAASFVDVTFAPSSPPPPPPPPPGPTPIGPPANIAGGTYVLGYDPLADVFCDGTLAGQEAAFAHLLPGDIGVGDGPVTVTIAGDAVEISGAIGFGGALQLRSDVDAPPGVFYEVVPASGSGPLSTDLIGVFLAVDDTSASPQAVAAAAGAGFLNATEDGFCQVSFAASLTP